MMNTLAVFMLRAVWASRGRRIANVSVEAYSRNNRASSVKIEKYTFRANCI